MCITALINHVFKFILCVSYSASCSARATSYGKSHDGFYAIWGESVILPENPFDKLQRVFSNVNIFIRFTFFEVQRLMKPTNPPNKNIFIGDGGLVVEFHRVFKCLGVCAERGRKMGVIFDGLTIWGKGGRENVSRSDIHL